MSSLRNIAVAGCGYWGRNLVRNFNDLGALHTICDASPDTLKELHSFYPQADTESDYSRVLKNEEIKGVVVSTPAALHYRMAKEAILAGKDVFVEKPLALDVDEGRELVTLAEDNGCVLLTGHLLEYHPAVTRLAEMVEKGELGEIQYIYSNRLNLGRFRTEEDIIWSFAPHDVSVILRLMNGEMPLKISAHGGYYLHEDIADVTLTAMDFGNGVRAHIFVSWLHPYKEQKLVVVGSKRMILFDDTSPEDKLFLYNHEIEWVEGKPIPHPGYAEVIKISAEEPLKIECRDFLECMKNRSKPLVDGNKGLQVLNVLSYCRKSLEEGGRTVMLNTDDADIFIHGTSIVEQPSRIGRGTRVWHYSHIMPDVTIGENCVLGQNTFIGRSVKIGNNVKLENNVSVFEGVTLEDDVFCGPSAVFTNVVNPRSHISRKDQFRPTLVRRGATIGANATIICGNTIGEYAFIGAGSIVTGDVPDYALVYGNPGRVQGWVCRCGVNLEKEGNKAKCPECGSEYILEGNTCSPVSGDKK